MRRNLGNTLKRLKALAPTISMPMHDHQDSSRLIELGRFGSNPGDLKAFEFVPKGEGRRPLVVVLHGCTQSAAGYDHGSGWSELAEQMGFALLYPEQQRANNPNLCFNWFNPGDTHRGRGEALSIRQMIAAMVDRGHVDPKRIYVTGLSAGGAMASVMLATYPELFAGGAIIAGLPFGAAKSVPEALERMRGQGLASSSEYAALVRKASPHRGPWPRISTWHGTADATVAPVNADAIIGQWQSLQEISGEPDLVGKVDGVPHRVWRNPQGEIAIEDYRVAGMGHGTPLKVGGTDGLGAAIPHMLDVGISSTRHVAEGWGLVKAHPTGQAHAPARRDRAPEPTAIRPSIGAVQATIEDALRAAGLMR